MDIAMLLGATFLSLANGFDDEHRDEALGMLQHFAGSQTFSPAERDILQTMVRMADDVFTRAAQRNSGRPNLRIVN